MPLTTSIRESIPVFLDLECFDYFKSVLNERMVSANYYRLLTDTSLIFSIDTFYLMCKNIFKDFITLGEPLNKSFNEYYLDAYTNPDGMGVSDIQVNESEYILDQNNVCPLCNKKVGHLQLTVNGQNIRNFRIATIFPDDLDNDIKHTFEGYEEKHSGSDNKIALCLSHYSIYNTTHNFEDYKRLVDVKKQIKFSKAFNEHASKLDLSKIEDIIVYLTNNTSTLTRRNLTLAVRNVREKIPSKEDYWLYLQIMNLVKMSYKQINKYMENNEYTNKNGSTELGEKIRALSIDLMNSGKKPGEVFSILTTVLESFVPSDLNDKKYYCSYLVAYYIAHCEVLSTDEAA